MTNSADSDQLATDLDLHCLLIPGMSCSAREGLTQLSEAILMSSHNIYFHREIRKIFT